MRGLYTGGIAVGFFVLALIVDVLWAWPGLIALTVSLMLAPFILTGMLQLRTIRSARQSGR